MTTRDWPTAEHFRPASVVPGMRAPKSAYTGVYTGDRETVSHLSDRQRLTLRLPACNNAAGADRKAYFEGLASTGDWVRISPQHMLENRGTLRGVPTVASDAVAGARSVTLTGALSGVNLLRNSSFEEDSNADGLSDLWTAYSSGTTGSVVYSRIPVASPFGLYKQRLQGTGLGTATGDRVGIWQVVPATALATYTLSAYWGNPTSTGRGILRMDWINSGGGNIASSQSANFPFVGPMTRNSFTATAPAGTVSARAYLWLEMNTAGPSDCTIDIDGAQFEPGPAATPYAGLATLLADDHISIGGNLLQTAYGGAAANDAGVMVLPLVLPLPKPLTAGALVTTVQPTGVFQLAVDQFEAPYGRGAWQAAIDVPLIQVVV